MSFNGKSHLRILSTKHIKHINGKTHILFDYLFLKNHGMSDQRWSLNHLIDNYVRTTNALKLHQEYEKHYLKSKREALSKNYRRLRKENNEGRQKLHSIIIGDTSHKVKMCLRNHKDLQRLFAKMSISEAENRVNDRTFVLRRERDRLQYRIYQLEEDLKQKLFERDENLTHPEMTDCSLFKDRPEHTKICNVMKKIQDSETRLKAIKLLHNVYKKMILILRNDCLFYDLILQSLQKDIEDQETFVTCIIHAAQPAISQKNDLITYHNKLLESRHHLQKVRSHRSTTKSIYSNIIVEEVEKPERVWSNQYVHRTSSMTDLDNMLRKVEKQILLVSNATFVAKPSNIIPTIKHSYNRMVSICKNTALNELNKWYYDFKLKSIALLYDYPGDNFVEYDLKIKKKIKKLQMQIEFEEQRENALRKRIKRGGHLLTIIRKSFWNMNETLRHVYEAKANRKQDYPSDYLNWPLLKYDHLVTDNPAQPPSNYEIDLGALMHSVKAKLVLLIDTLQRYPKKYTSRVKKLRNIYQNKYTDIRINDSLSITSSRLIKTSADHDLNDKQLTTREEMQIPTNYSIKARSRRILDDHKKEEEILNLTRKVR